ncbi:MAG: uncharacterized protein A8A55_1966 [Amphiamblys sp. WSBS2006]|nr:MAG: uncharacterized protein A8A55_1966 [Amphiamblys sp. WSBS2006]
MFREEAVQHSKIVGHIRRIDPDGDEDVSEDVLLEEIVADLFEDERGMFVVVERLFFLVGEEAKQTTSGFVSAFIRSLSKRDSTRSRKIADRVYEKLKALSSEKRQSYSVLEMLEEFVTCFASMSPEEACSLARERQITGMLSVDRETQIASMKRVGERLVCLDAEFVFLFIFPSVLSVIRGEKTHPAVSEEAFRLLGAVCAKVPFSAYESFVVGCVEDVEKGESMEKHVHLINTVFHNCKYSQEKSMKQIGDRLLFLAKKKNASGARAGILCSVVRIIWLCYEEKEAPVRDVVSVLFSFIKREKKVHRNTGLVFGCIGDVFGWRGIELVVEQSKKTHGGIVSSVVEEMISSIQHARPEEMRGRAEGERRGFLRLAAEKTRSGLKTILETAAVSETKSILSIVLDDLCKTKKSRREIRGQIVEGVVARFPDKAEELDGIVLYLLKRKERKSTSRKAGLEIASKRFGFLSEELRREIFSTVCSEIGRKGTRRVVSLSILEKLVIQGDVSADGEKIRHKLFDMLSKASPRKGYVPGLFRVISALIQRRGPEEITDVEAKTLLCFLSPDMSDYSPQLELFLLLEGVVERKTDTPELHRAMELAKASMMSRQSSKEMKSVCRRVYAKYLAGYYFTQTRFESLFVKGVLGDIESTQDYRRENVLDFLGSFLAEASSECFLQHAEIVFLAVSSRIANERNQMLRKTLFCVVEKFAVKSKPSFIHRMVFHMKSWLLRGEDSIDQILFSLAEVCLRVGSGEIRQLERGLIERGTEIGEAVLQGKSVCSEETFYAIMSFASCVPSSRGKRAVQESEKRFFSVLICDLFSHSFSIQRKRCEIIRLALTAGCICGFPEVMKQSVSFLADCTLLCEEEITLAAQNIAIGLVQSENTEGESESLSCFSALCQAPAGKGEGLIAGLLEAVGAVLSSVDGPMKEAVAEIGRSLFSHAMLSESEDLRVKGLELNEVLKGVLAREGCLSPREN